MKLETVVINGMKIHAFVTEKKDGSYTATIGRKNYSCQKKDDIYTLIGDSLRTAIIGDKPLFPETESEEDETDKPELEKGLDMIS